MKPEGIFFGVDDQPPLGTRIGCALQHVSLQAVGLVFPILVVAASGRPDLLATVVAVSLAALGIGSILQSLRGRMGIGSGYLIPCTFTAAYLPASLAAAELGGLGLVLGMTIFAGCVTLVLSRAVHRLRAFLPSEIAGFVVVMIGIILGELGVAQLFGALPYDAPAVRGLAIEHLAGVATLCITIGLNIWARGPFRMFCALIGIVTGYALVAILAPEALGRSTAITATPFWQLSWPVAAPRFDLLMVVPFTIGAIACMLRATGDIITAQKINATDWVRPNTTSIRSGIVADGIGTIIAGLIGTVGLNTYSASIGVSRATGVTARSVGTATGIALIILALVPGVPQLIAAMPAPVMGGALIFASAFIILSGIQIITQRMLDSRRIITLGIGLVMALAHDIHPHIFDDAPAVVQPLLSSSLVVGVLTVLALNALFRIGVRRSAVLDITTTPPAGTAAAGTDTAIDMADRLQTFMEQQGGSWGARRDVVHRATSALMEALELMPELTGGTGPDTAPARLRLSFDEFNLDAVLSWQGRPFTAASGIDPLSAAEAGDHAALARALIQRYADKLTITEDNGWQVLSLHFAH
ncbi:solute carrier family 23 protein [Tistrella bauzanensis]|jgi:NCS2 family nucleobase:cation symporter-2|uniref:Solute carrier family 23 protein n=1 Tax=Tistrella arctica TaxID=3133430 RepID=A0ABU9YHA4_9PROT